jgi:glutathione S-transferase
MVKAALYCCKDPTIIVRKLVELMSKITLYHFPLSSCSRKVTAVLRFKNIDYDEIIINLQHGEQKKQDFRKINPQLKVPVLKYENTFICESSIINEFLEEQFPYPPLLPKEFIDRALVRNQIAYADNSFYPAISQILYETRKLQKDRNTDFINSLISEFANSKMSYLETSLEKSSPFLFGKLTLADIAYAPGLDTLIKSADFSLSKYPNSFEWLKNIKMLNLL